MFLAETFVDGPTDCCESVHGPVSQAYWWCMAASIKEVVRCKCSPGCAKEVYAKGLCRVSYDIDRLARFERGEKMGDNRTLNGRRKRIPGSPDWTKALRATKEEDRPVCPRCNQRMPAPGDPGREEWWDKYGHKVSEDVWCESFTEHERANYRRAKT